GCGSTHPRFHPLRRVLPEIPPPGDLPAPGRHKCWSGPRVELEKPGARLHKTDTPEGWPSGLRRTLGKRVYVKAYRGFESHSLRQCYPAECSQWEFRAQRSPITARFRVQTSAL